MSNPIDEETYGDRAEHDPKDVQHGNPGKPQSYYLSQGTEETEVDPSDFGDDPGEVVPGTVRPTRDES